MKVIVRYVLMPIAMIFVLVGLYLFAGRSIEALLLSQIYMAAEQGVPHVTYESLDTELQFDIPEKVKLSEIKFPEVGEKYAYLRCDRLQINAPVYYGDDEEILLKGVGQYSDSTLPGFSGTTLLCAHDTTWFQGLESVEKKDVFLFETDYGVYEYQVQRIEIVDQSDESACELEKTQDQLVLYTCYPFGNLIEVRQERFFVYCNLISGPEIWGD